MADFTYKNITITGAATLAEAKQQAAVAYLSQLNEEPPTQQEIDTLLAEIEVEAVERLDLDGLDSDITNQLAWADTTVPEIDNGLSLVDSAFATPSQRAIIRGILQNQRRIVLILKGMLKAWRFVIRKIGV